MRVAVALRAYAGNAGTGHVRFSPIRQAGVACTKSARSVGAGGEGALTKKADDRSAGLLFVFVN